MAERFTLDQAGYILYSDMVERLRERFPAVPAWRLEQVAAAEHDAITGGVLQIVPVEVEDGTIEMLERESQSVSAENEGVA
jgi:hypothetical protein